MYICLILHGRACSSNFLNLTWKKIEQYSYTKLTYINLCIIYRCFTLLIIKYNEIWYYVYSYIHINLTMERFKAIFKYRKFQGQWYFCIRWNISFFLFFFISYLRITNNKRKFLKFEIKYNYFISHCLSEFCSYLTYIWKEYTMNIFYLNYWNLRVLQNMTNQGFFFIKIRLSLDDALFFSV